MRFELERTLALAERFAFPRLTLSAEARRAADLVAEDWAAAGLEVERPEVVEPPLWIGLGILIGLSVWLWAAIRGLWPAMQGQHRLYFAGLGVASIFWAMSRSASTVRARGYTGKRPAHVVGRRPGGESAASRVVLVTRIESYPVRWRLLLTGAALLVFFVLGAVLGLILLSRPSDQLIWLGRALLLIQWASGLFVFLNSSPPPEPPNPTDNRTGLALVSELARTWNAGAADRPERIFAATFAKADLARLVGEERPRRPTLVIVVECPGLGDAIVIQGSPAAARLARAAAHDLWLPARSPFNVFNLLTMWTYGRRGLAWASLGKRRPGRPIDPALLGATAQLATEMALRWGRDQAERAARSSQNAG